MCLAAHVTLEYTSKTCLTLKLIFFDVSNYCIIMTYKNLQKNSKKNCDLGTSLSESFLTHREILLFQKLCDLSFCSTDAAKEVYVRTMMSTHCALPLMCQNVSNLSQHSQQEFHMEVLRMWVCQKDICVEFNLVSSVLPILLKTALFAWKIHKSNGNWLTLLLLYCIKLAFKFNLMFYLYETSYTYVFNFKRLLETSNFAQRHRLKAVKNACVCYFVLHFIANLIYTYLVGSKSSKSSTNSKWRDV